MKIISALMGNVVS